MTPTLLRVDALPGFTDNSVFRSVFAASPDALLVVDPTGKIVLANHAASALLGYANGELVGLMIEALVPESIRPRHAEYRNAYARKPHARPMGTQMDLVARRRDGSEVMVEIALSPLQEQGLPYVVAAVRGIGAYPRVKQALQRARYSEQVAQFGRLAVDARDPQELLDQAPHVARQTLELEQAAVWLLDPDGRQLRLAAGAGLPPGDRLGLRVPNQADTLVGHALIKNKTITIDDQSDEPALSLPPLSVGAPFRSSAATPLLDRGQPVGVLTVHACDQRQFGTDEVRFLDSLSSLLATSLQRAQSEEALKHSQRLESVGQLTGGIAHDFNNLLTIISGNLQVLEDLPALLHHPLAQQVLASASRASRRGAELTSKLLAFSRRQVLQPSAVDVMSLLDSLTDMLRRTLDQRIHIAMSGECPACLADPGQLESALLNIAINPRDAMPDGGQLRFSCRSIERPPGELDAELNAGAYVEISVSDSGVGMSEEVKKRAFEPFFTTKEAGRGTGLGLPTVYGFAKQSRGAVRLDSTVGVGTTVSLYLPSLPGVKTSIDASEPVERLPDGLRILLVEDDAEVRRVAHLFLVAMGAEVTACANAEQALALLKPDVGVDLLLTDIALGAGMRGTELAQTVKQRWPQLPILLMSGYSSELLGTPLEWRLLPKPYTRAELARSIAKVLAAV